MVVDESRETTPMLRCVMCLPFYEHLILMAFLFWRFEPRLRYNTYLSCIFGHRTADHVITANHGSVYRSSVDR